MGTRSIAGLIGWFLFYVALSMWLTWPLIAESDVTLPCTNAACIYDTLYSAWAMAWQSHALVTATATLGDANIFYPARDALYYGPAGFGALPYFAPFYLASGNAALATNLFLLLCVSLSALSLHWVVQRWTGLASAGLVAASSLLVHRWYLWGFVATTPHLAPLQYFPLIIWLAAAPLESPARGLLLAALIVAQCLTDLVYVTPAVIAPLAMLAVSRLVRPTWRRSGFGLLGVLAAALLCLLPFVLGYLGVRADNPLLAAQTPWRSLQIESPPRDLGSLFWRSVSPSTIAPTALVLIVVGAGVAALRRRRMPLAVDRAWAHGLLWTLAGAWISLPPVAQWGNHRVSLPQSLLAATTPLYDVVRQPERLGVASMIGACILSGIAFAELVRVLDRRFTQRRSATLLRSVLAGGVMLSLYAIGPAATRPLPARFPLQDAPSVPVPFLPELRQGGGPLLQLPALTRGPDRSLHGRSNAVAMYFSTFHWRPILNGYSSYWPAGFMSRMALAEQLPKPSALALLVDQTGLEMIWVDLLSYPREKHRPWRDAERGLVPGLELRARYKGHLLFAVNVKPLRRRAADEATQDAHR